MTCRQFENALRLEFGTANPEEWKDRITRENWEGLPDSENMAHLIACSDCQDSLFKFLEVRKFLDYESHPCFHVAYYAADTPSRCLDTPSGLYAIITDREKGEGIVIGFCPWCGIELPTAIRSSAD